MSSVALLLILGSAGIHATWNLLAKRLPGGAESVWLFTAVSTPLYLPVAALAVARSGYRPTGVDWLLLGGTGVLQAVYFVVLRRGYAAGDLSIVYPLARGTGPLVAVTLAISLVGERPSPLTIAGALAISAGTLLLARPGRSERGQGLAVAFGLATGLIIGVYSVWDGYAVGTRAIPALLMVWAAEVGRLLWLAPIATRRRDRMAATLRAHRGDILALGVLSPASYALVLLAMAIAPISSIAPAREISIVAGTALGMTVLGEPVGARRLAASAIIAAGVILIALG